MEGQLNSDQKLVNLRYTRSGCVQDGEQAEGNQVC